LYKILPKLFGYNGHDMLAFNASQIAAYHRHFAFHKDC